jgi:hypothetical protein
MASAEACGKSNESESSECVPSSQASSDKDSSSPLLIKTVFAVISEAMIRGRVCPLCFEQRRHCSIEVSRHTNSKKRKKDGPWWDGKVDAILPHNMHTPPLITCIHHLITCIDHLITCIDPLITCIDPLITCIAPLITCIDPETCGKSSESSEDVRSTQASSDKDSSSPLLIKTVFAVISEAMIRGRVCPLCFEQRRHCSIEVSRHTNSKKRKKDGPWWDGKVDAILPHNMHTPPLITCIHHLITCIDHLITCIDPLITCIAPLITCIAPLITCIDPETCGKSSESSEDVRSTQASSDKDSSSPLLIKTVFAVISEAMIRGRVCPLCFEQRRHCSIEVSRHTNSKKRKKDGPWWDGKVDAILPHNMHTPPLITCIHHLITCIDHLITCIDPLITCIDPLITCIAPLITCIDPETCGKSSESSEDVRSTQASSDKDSSSPLLIKTVFAVISEDMIR